jgi:hypothetical protein
VPPVDALEGSASAVHGEECVPAENGCVIQVESAFNSAAVTTAHVMEAKSPTPHQHPLTIDDGIIKGEGGKGRILLFAANSENRKYPHRSLILPQ